jgi:hypothetical protein
VTACAIRGCARPVHARGFCALHYYRWWRHSPQLCADGRPYVCTCTTPDNGTGIECRRCRRPVRERLAHVAALVDARQRP